MKIAVIGGGSTYTPELLEGLIDKAKSLSIDEIVLHDIWKERLDIVGSFCQRMAEHAKSPVRILLEPDRIKAVSGSDFVITQIRVGGWQGRHQDILTGLKYGIIGQETTGVGGFAKAIRTIPVILDIAKTVEKHAPNAWIINFTNPSAIITETLLNHSSAKAVGLCNVPIEMQIEIGQFLGTTEDKVHLEYAGLNHLGWIMDVIYDGKSRMKEVMDELKKGGGPANIPELNYPDEMWDALNMIPSPYLRYFYATDTMLDKIRAKSLSRAQEVANIEEELLEIYQDTKVTTKPEALDKRGGAWYSKIAVLVIEALSSSSPMKLIVNTSNLTTIPELPKDAAIEVNANLSSKGIEPVPLMKPVPESIVGLISQVKCYERLTIQAGVHKCRKSALLALMNHPLVPTVETAARIVDYLVVNRGFNLS